METEYIHTDTIVKGNCVIRIHRPVLTPEERERRMDEIKAATKRLLIAAYYKK